MHTQVTCKVVFFNTERGNINCPCRYDPKKLVSATFYQILIFYQMIALQNLWKLFLFHLKSSFHFRDIQISAFLSSPLFFLPVRHCFRGWSRKNLKVYDAINCLNKILITHFVWYLEKEITCDIETLSTDRDVTKEHFLWKNHAENVHQKLVQDPFLILLSNPNKPLHARNSFKYKILLKGIISKGPKKVIFSFSFESSPF